jgi:hypothetical protein
MMMAGALSTVGLAPGGAPGGAEDGGAPEGGRSNRGGGRPTTWNGRMRIREIRDACDTRYCHTKSPNKTSCESRTSTAWSLDLDIW